LSADCLREIEARVRELRSGHPFLPVAVVVPSHLLGTWLAPRLFVDTGHLAISFLLLPELAWRVAEAGALAQGLGAVPENVDLALVLASAAEAAEAGETPGYLKDAVGTAGFGPALLRSLRDLAACGLGAEALERLAPRSADAERLCLLARSARGLGDRLDKARLLDRPAIYRLASAALPSPAVGGVVLHGVDDPPPAAAGFLEALRRNHPFAVVPETGLAAASPRLDGRQRALLLRLDVAVAESERSGRQSSLQRMRQRLFERRTATGAQAAEAQPLDDTVHLLAAAGESMEAVEIARLVQQAVAAGTRPGQVAVLLRDPARYAAPLASAFERAAIAAFFVEGEPRVDPAARGLGLLLDLVGGDLERRAVMELFTTARIPWESLLGKDAAISPAQWDRLSARAGIVSGLDSWRTRLAEARVARQERGFEDDRDLRLYDSLLQVVERLRRDLASFPQDGGWSDFLAATLGLLDAWIVDGRLVQERLERVIGPLGRFAPAPTREAFLVRVRALLATQVYREGSLADDRVLVSSIAGARGLRFRMVVIPGLVERAFPTVARPDPLLLDEERETLSPDLRTTRDVQEAERVLFLRAVRAAEQRLVLSYPRFDTGSGRERVPSSFLLQAVETAMGRWVTAAELLHLASPGATGLGRPHPDEPDAAIDRIERDLAAVAGGRPGAARHLLGGDGFVAQSVALERAGWEPQLTPFDGLVDLGGDDAAVAKLAPGGRTSSATEVQTLAGCPYRHLLTRGFRLEPWEEPERVYQVDGLTFGSLYHRAAECLFTWLRDQAWLPLERERLPAMEARLRTIVDETCREAMAQGQILNEALLAPVAGSLHSALAEMLQHEAARADRFVPAAFEQRFEGVEVPLGNGRAISFRGLIDRVDVAARPTKAVRVVDYKTGKSQWKDGEQFRGGRELQLAIYNRAAAMLYPKATVSEALYSYATPAGRYKEKGCPASSQVDETLVQVLRTLDDTARAGVFAPVADTCDFCDFQSICGAPRAARAERKQGDPRLAAFLGLRAIP
jgi:RecB family exonuclease